MLKLLLLEPVFSCQMLPNNCQFYTLKFLQNIPKYWATFGATFPCEDWRSESSLDKYIVLSNIYFNSMYIYFHI